MRLKGYGLGEVSDRLSILALKRLYGAQAGKDITHFIKEWRLLLDEIRSRTLNGNWVENVLELVAVNAALWHTEDALRELKVPFRTKAEDWLLIRVAEIAFRIQDLNDQRAAMIERINKATGEHAGPEKL